MSTELKKANNDFEKDFLTVENVRKHRDIKIVTTEARRKYLVSCNSF